MALVKCVECGQEISDMATACPKCGRPTRVEIKRKSPWGATILNFLFWFPAYLYLGEYLLGIALLVAVINGAYLYFAIPAIYVNTPTLLMGTVASCLFAIDGYQRVQKYNEAQLKK
jgi:DNA-directed RNA polymerase subunit RPC12/RpoP